MSGSDQFPATIKRLHELLADCEDLRRDSGILSTETSRRLAETEKMIADCVEQLGRELLT